MSSDRFAETGLLSKRFASSAQNTRIDTLRMGSQHIEAERRSPFLSNDQAAQFLNLSPRTLEKMRVVGGGPSLESLGDERCTPLMTSSTGPGCGAAIQRRTFEEGSAVELPQLRSGNCFGPRL